MSALATIRRGRRNGHGRRATAAAGALGAGALAVILSVAVAVALIAAAAPAELSAQAVERGTPVGEWRQWGADNYGTRYSPLDQIDASNFEQLQVAWIWRGDNFSPGGPDPILRSTPIYADGRLYTVAGSRRSVAAVDPATGETLWTFREAPTKRYEDSMRKNYGKGVAYEEVDGRGRIYLITPAFFLWALDAETGRPVEGFGDEGEGVVDLITYLGDWEHDREDGLPSDVGYITNSTPPVIVNGTIVVGNSHEQGYYQTRRENVPGNIMGFDTRTGAHKWTFDVIPRPGEYGHDTWLSDAWSYTGNVSAWAPMTVDPELGLVYVGTDPPTIDYFGGFHPGENLFSTTILALDAETGERRWHFQTVHHDVWNYDMPAQPSLLDVTIDGQPRKILAQTTKQSFVYVLDRETGEPIWPIEERPVPQTDVPGEWTSPTQPFPTRPAPYEMQGISEDDLIDFTPELRAEALEIVSEYRMGPLFNPPMVSGQDGIQAAIHCPGANGGTNIPGGTVADPETGILYTATQRGCSAPRLQPGTDVDPDSNVDWVSVGPGGVGGPQGLPLVKPPYASITAIDMNTGEHLWSIPNGYTPDRIKDHPALQGVDLGNTGTTGHATALVTRSLFIYAEGRGQRPVLYAIDKRTAEPIGQIDIPAPTNTAPMTYMHEGDQYIVLPVGSGELPGSLVALKLP